jgi:menaquinone-specific isochorismate synthase
MRDLLDFLEASSQFPKVYWKSRGSTKVIAGCGSGHSAVRFGGLSFSPQSCQGIWSSFPATLSFSPAILQEKTWSPSVLPFTFPKLISRKDTPTFEQWWMLVDDALEQIEKGFLKKVVLARQTCLTFEDKINPFQVMRMLNPLGNQTSLFLLQLDDQTTFLGATPEKLFHRKDRKIFSEVLAGTKDQHEKWSFKEAAEVEAVQLFLNDKLFGCCKELQWHCPEQKEFGTLCHLYQSLEGQLKEDILDEQLLAELHPTPSLGGLPKQASLAYLAHVEHFHRGWYGGCFGTVSPEETDMSVTIRSALIRGNEMHLFAGAGIVKGSHPKKEWEEIDRKIAHYLKVFHE